MINYSIIIPHFSKGGTELLDRAISSIPIRSDIEIIVVDNSLTPINDDLYIGNPSVKIIYSDNNRGAGGARNEGMSIAEGRWLLFMDADDFFVERAFDSFDKYLEDDSDVIFFKPTSCFSDSMQAANRHYVFCAEIDYYLKTRNEFGLRYREFDVPWAKMIKREFVNTNKITFEEVPASNDVMFSLKTGFAANKISASPDTVYCVTVTEGSITKTPSLRNLESIFEVKMRKNKLLKDNGYRRECSVLSTIYKSRKFGPKVFFHFISRALLTGNIFVGFERWPDTFIDIIKALVSGKQRKGVTSKLR